MGKSAWLSPVLTNASIKLKPGGIMIVIPSIVISKADFNPFLNNVK